VRYSNILRSAAGVAAEIVRVPADASLPEVLARLADRHGAGLRPMLFEPDGSVASHLVVFRNRRLVPRTQYDLPLAEGDELMLFPAVSGG
ncbi:MAG: MoaD/ThiS family protein, partial [Anaerolineae bacterium]|nr:MoaD/ThiS family protein [Anaerolineae bacterium]